MLLPDERLRQRGRDRELLLPGRDFMLNTGYAAAPSYTKLIQANLNGTAGSTTITNSVAGGMSLSISGNGVLTTTTKKFGTAAADNNISGGPGYGHLTGATSQSFAGQFGMYAWFRAGSNQGVLVNMGNVDSTNGGVRFAHYLGTLYLSVRNAGTTTDIDSEPFSWTSGQFQFVSMDRDASGVIRCCIDGVVLMSATDTSTFTGKLTAGDHDGGGFVAAGYWDDWCVVSGGRLFTSYPYTPPTAELVI